jgi:hypothetical protein
MMNLNKHKRQELRQLLLNAVKTATENAILDNLNLGEFKYNSGKLLLSSHKGAQNGSSDPENAVVQ